MELLIGLGVLLGILGLLTLIAITFRRVVSTNEVHIVQSAKKTTSYGKDTGNGNTYYELPSAIPVFGVTKIVLPVSVFDLDLQNYEAYDKGRLPFVVDIKAFFRINDSNIAAQRVSSFKELQNQLQAIVQGAVRVILASNDIEEILQGRATFGDQFTKEVAEQLRSWGVCTVKNIELMDIRDSKDGNVIRNIMEKKKSLIDMESRTEVAKNKKIAQMAELEAQQEIEVTKQKIAQEVGLRTVEAQKQVELANQETLQTIKDQEKITKDKQMEIVRIEHVRTAEINKQVELVRSQQQKEVADIEKQAQIIKAEQNRDIAVLNAEANLETAKKHAEGVVIEGQAKADAEKAMQLAPVEAQIVLAKEIGSNESYQKYLITIRQLEADQVVGIEQAKALEKANVKIISNTGDPVSGLNGVSNLFSSSGGTKIGAMLEGLAQSDIGQALVTKLTTSKK